MKRFLLIAVLISVAGLCGCATSGGNGSRADVAVRPAPNAFERVGWFIPDRCLDLLDILSVGLGGGYGISANRQITAWCHVPTIGAYRCWNIFNWKYNRNFSWWIEKEGLDFGLLPLYSYRYKLKGSGTGWDNGAPGEGVKEYDGHLIAKLDDPMYAEGTADPWAIGGAYGPAILSPRIELALHPVEIGDFIAGLFTLGFVDIRSDDLVYD